MALVQPLIWQYCVLFEVSFLRGCCFEIPRFLIFPRRLILFYFLQLTPQFNKLGEINSLKFAMIVFLTWSLLLLFSTLFFWLNLTSVFKDFFDQTSRSGFAVMGEAFIVGNQSLFGDSSFVFVRNFKVLFLYCCLQRKRPYFLIIGFLFPFI